METIRTTHAADTKPPATPGAPDAEGTAVSFGDYAALAPKGIGIDAALGVPGSDGQGQHLADIEEGWTIDHECLKNRGLVLQGLMNNGSRSHGTSVVGIACGNATALGPSGLASRATPHIFSTIRQVVPGQPGVIASAIQDARHALDAITPAPAGGGRPAVLLITMRAAFGGWNLPAEARMDVYRAISDAVQNGYTVIESAGNGRDGLNIGGNLDLYQHDGAVGDPENTRTILRRTGTAADVRADSGAIIVGAADPAAFGAGHKVYRRSNFGSRVDCYAWGANVKAPTSVNTAQAPAPPQYSLNTFGDFADTSAAAAIIAGLVLVIQGAVTAQTGKPLVPLALRALLSDQANGTPVLNDAGQQIGVMPDLGKVLQTVFT